MLDWLSHPLVVATYVAALSLVVAGVRAVVRLFSRVDDVEDKVDRIGEGLDRLGDDLRVHMEQEEHAMAVLVRAVNVLMRQKEDRDAA